MKIQIKGVTNTNFEIKKGGFYSNFGDSLTPQVLNILITELKENPIHIFLERKEQVDLFSKLYLDIPKLREFVECLNQPDLERLIMDKVKSRDHVIIIPSHPTLMDFAELPLIDGIYHENCFESVFLDGVNKTFLNFISLEAFYKSINFRFSDWDLDVFINELNEEIRAVEFDFNINLIHKDSVLSEVKKYMHKISFFETN